MILLLLQQLLLQILLSIANHHDKSATCCEGSVILRAPCITLVIRSEFIGMFSMFGGTEASTKREPHRPQNVGQQHDIFWPVGAFLSRVATFVSLLGAAFEASEFRKLYLKAGNKLTAKQRTVVQGWIYGTFFVHWCQNICEGRTFFFRTCHNPTVLVLPVFLSCNQHLNSSQWIDYFVNINAW